MATKRKSKVQFLVRKVTVVRAAETGLCGASALTRIVSDRAISGEQREKISFHQINKKWMRPTS
jgi:hypothetical protein